MATETPDLWPVDLVVNVLSPAMILNEQAEALARKTQGIVKGEVLSGVAGQFEQLAFDLLAPAVGFRHRLLRIRYPKEYPYPVVLIAEWLFRSFSMSSQEDYADPKVWNLSATEQNQARCAHSPDEVRELLKAIFNAPTTRATLFSLIARSNEVAATVKGEAKPSEEQSPTPVSP